MAARRAPAGRKAKGAKPGGLGEALRREVAEVGPRVRALRRRVQLTGYQVGTPARRVGVPSPVAPRRRRLPSSSFAVVCSLGRNADPSAAQMDDALGLDTLASRVGYYGTPLADLPVSLAVAGGAAAWWAARNLPRLGRRPSRRPTASACRGP